MIINYTVRKIKVMPSKILRMIADYLGDLLLDVITRIQCLTGSELNRMEFKVNSFTCE